MTEFVILGRLRRCSCTSIPRPGLIFAGSMTAMRTISRIQLLPRMSIAASASIFPNSSRIIATICGELPLRIRRRVMLCGEARLRRGPSMERLCHARRGFPAVSSGATMRVLRTIKDRYGKGAWCRYGFVDAFNPLTNWYDS